MMPNQDEQECLNSEKFNFKDPDVLFVANLGSRGLETKKDQYWVRYKAKNSYGAYLQGNMLCMKQNEKWVRDTSSEYLLSLSVESYLLEKTNELLRTSPEFTQEYIKNGGKGGRETEKAKDILFVSTGNLEKYIKNK